MNVREDWVDLLVPDCEGLVDSQNVFRSLEEDGSLVAEGVTVTAGFLGAQVLADASLLSGKYHVSCGEVFGHGSIGFVVVEGVVEGGEFWVFVSERTDPFDQIVVKGGFVLVLSSSGAVFRFRPGMLEPSCCLSRKF